MNDFDDIQQKAQDMTSGVTDGSPAHVVNPPSNGENFTYSGYGEQGKPKTKGPGDVTVTSGRTSNRLATPYAGGGSYPGAILYGAEVDPDDTIVGLKSKYAPVEPYDIQIGGMAGKVDTLNMKKAFAELVVGHVPRGVNMGHWSGYDMPLDPAEEGFFSGIARGALNTPGTLGAQVTAAPSWITGSIITAYGDLTNDENAINYGNDMLQAVRDATEEAISRVTFDYGEGGDNSGQNKSGLIVGSLIGSMPLSLLAPLGGAATFAAVEGLSNAYEARYAAFDRGVSGASGLGIALGAGAGTAALGVSSRFIEPVTKGMFRPSIGWARALKEDPKLFMRQTRNSNLVLMSYDAGTESLQDMWSSYLGNGRLDAEDWEQAWLTLVFGGAIGAMTAAVKTKADKKTQQYYNEQINNLYAAHKDAFDRVIKESDGAITQETVDIYFDFLREENTKDGFVLYLKNKMAENLDRYDSMPDEFKQRIQEIVKAGNGVAPLSSEMAALDANINNVLESMKGAPKASVEATRQFVRGVAMYDYLYRGTNPSEFKLPKIKIDAEINPSTDVSGRTKGTIHLVPNSGKSLKPVGEGTLNEERYSGAQQVSAQVRNEAVRAAQGSENATFNNPKARAQTLHELMHWAEMTTGLKNVGEFTRRMTAWAENVLPNITTGKKEGSLERSEAYAYAVEYAKSLKDLLGLEGDMRKYIEFFNAVSGANYAAASFEAYNKLLASEIKQNAATIDDLLSSYGEDKLREVIKQYTETGNLGLLKQEDLTRLFQIMESVVDAQTIEKMNTAFGDKATAQSFIDRYNAEYDAEQTRLANAMATAKAQTQKNKEKYSQSVVQQSNDVQQAIIEQTDTGEEIKEEKQTESEEPPFRQYSGEPYKLVRAKEDANWIERYLSGEKLPADIYAGISERFKSDALRAIGVLPSPNARYSVRQNLSSNKGPGVMTAVWNPTPEELKSMGLPSVDSMSSDQLTAVGRWLAVQDVNKVWSVSDDIDDITGGGNNNAFYDMMENQDATNDKAAIQFMNEAKDVVTSLQNFSASLTHGGTNLPPTEAAYEMSLIDRALDLLNFDTRDIKGVDAKARIEKFLDGINTKELWKRKEYLAHQIANAVSQDQLEYLGLSQSPYAVKNTTTPDPWAKVGGYQRSPFKEAMEYGDVEKNPKYFDIPYWVSRMGRDVDQYPTADALEAAVKKKGLKPVDFTGVTVRVGDRDIPLFEPSTIEPAQVGALFGHAGVNTQINAEFNIKALNQIFDGHPSHAKLMQLLMRRVKDQFVLDDEHLPLSLEEQLREFAAIARAKTIADTVLSQYNNVRTSFKQWATLSPKGRVAIGADIAALTDKRAENKLNNFETLQAAELSAGRSPYISAKNINVKNMKVGTQLAVLFSGGWKQGVITANNMYTGDGNPFYVIRIMNDGQKGTYDLVWDAREFELLQKTPFGDYDNALFMKPEIMTREEFSKVVSDDYWKANYKESEEGDAEKYNFTALAADAKLRRRNIPILEQMGSEAVATYEDIYGPKDEDVAYSIDADDFMSDYPDYLDSLTDEEFENVDNIRQRAITGEEKTNLEVYQKMKLSEEASRKPVTNYLDRYVPGLGLRMVPAIKEITKAIEARKISPALFFLTGGAGIQGRLANLMGDDWAQKFGFNLKADRAERTAQSFKKDLETVLTQNIFKNQKELGEWQVKVGIDMKDVKAEMSDGRKRAISKDEIMSLYIAELGKNGDNEFKLPYVYGGVIEENGNSYLYNKLKAEYKNFDELISHLTKQDKDAAEVLARMLPVLKGVDMGDTNSWFGRFVPVTTYGDYTVDGGWDNRRQHNTAVFGTRLLDPSSRLVASGAFATAMNMAGSAGVRQHNYLAGVQALSDMLNLAALGDDKNLYSRGFRTLDEMSDPEKQTLQEAIVASEELRQVISDKIGARNFRSLMANIDNVLTKNESGKASSLVGEIFQKITRTAAAQALAFKPRQALTNLTGNYSVLGGLSSHGALWYNTVGFANALSHFREAWEGVTTNPAFKARLEQAALSEQYKRAADMKAESLIQDIEKIAYSHGREGVGNALSMLDALAKVMTKYSIGVTNTLPDMVGLALGRYTVFEDVKASIAAQAAADKVEMDEKALNAAAENQIADYMFSHISSSNVMARGMWSKNMARAGFEGMVAFKNDALQKSAALANAWSRLNNSDDPIVRKQAANEIWGIVLSTAEYVAIQAGLVFALLRTLGGEDMSDKEKEYLYESLLREFTAQVADAFNASFITQPVLEALFMGKQGNFDFLPMTDIFRFTRNVRKGDHLMAGATTAGLMGMAPAERAVQLTRGLSMAFGDDERAAQVGWLMVAGRSEATAKNMYGYTTNKAGKIVPKKTKNNKE